MSAVVDLSTLNGTTGFRLEGDDGGDNSGESVSDAGDVNGDGFDDLLVGAPNADPGGDSASGQTYVVFGKAGGFSASLDLESLNGTNGFRLNGVNAGDYSGVSVAGAGDVNGDGFDDLLIGAPNASPGGDSAAGQTCVVFGKAGGFSASLNLGSLNGTDGFRLNGIDELDHSGSSISGAGDVNGDGFDDLIIGADGGDPGGERDAGETYVVFGKAGGFGASLGLGSLNGTNGFRLDGITPFDRSGRSVSGVGDVNGDGFDDLLIGAPFAEAGPLASDHGEAYVVLGKAGGFGASLGLGSLDGTNGYRLDGADDGDVSGSSVSGAGDVNGDGFDDLIIGARLGDPGGGSAAGETYVVFGGTPTLGNLGPSVQYVASSAPVPIADQATVADSGNHFADSELVAQLTNGYVNDRLTIIPSAAVTTSGSNVSVNGALVGSFAGGPGTTALTITFNAAATQAGVQAVLRRIGFSSVVSGPGLFDDRNVQLTFTDGTGAVSPTVNKTAGISNTPGIHNLGPTVNYLAGGAAVLIAAQAIAADGGNNFANSILSTRLTNGDGADRLTIVSSLLVTTSGSDVSFNGTLVGSFSGGSGTTGLTITFNAAATQASVQGVLRRIGFSSVGNGPGLFDRNVQFTLTDGTGAASAAVAKTARVSNAPGLSNLGPTVSYTAGGVGVLVANQAKAADGGDDFANSVLAAQLTNGGVNDRLTILASLSVTTSGSDVSVDGALVGSFAGGPGTTALTITFNAAATQARVQAVLRRISFSSVVNGPSRFDRNVTLTFTDGTGAASASVSKTANVSNTPGLYKLGPPVRYTAGGAVALFAAQAIAADGGNNFANSILSTRLTNGDGADRLTIVSSLLVTTSGSDVSFNGTLVGSFSGGSGTTALTITFNAAATQASVQAVLRRIGFFNTSGAPAVFTRDVEIQLTDGTSAAGVAVTKQIYLAASVSPQKQQSAPGSALQEQRG